MQYLTNVVEGSGVVLQERKQRPVFGFLMASNMSWLVQELRSSLKSFWSWQWWGVRAVEVVGGQQAGQHKS